MINLMRDSKWKSWRSLILTILICMTSTKAGAVGETLPVFPSEGKSAENFCPKGWKLFKKASGDLTNDGKADLAMIFIKEGDNPEGGYLDKDFPTSLRPVVVALASGNGKFKRAAISPEGIFHGEAANSMALLAVEISIEKGNIVLNQGNGATSIQNYGSKFRLQNGKFELIGMTSNRGRTDEGREYNNDFNLNTGYSEYSADLGVKMDTGKADSSTSYSYYRLRSGQSQTLPSQADTGNDRPLSFASKQKNLLLVVRRIGTAAMICRLF